MWIDDVYKETPGSHNGFPPNSDALKRFEVFRKGCAQNVRRFLRVTMATANLLLFGLSVWNNSWLLPAARISWQSCVILGPATQKCTHQDKRRNCLVVSTSYAAFTGHIESFLLLRPRGFSLRGSERTQLLSWRPFEKQRVSSWFNYWHQY